MRSTARPLAAALLLLAAPAAAQPAPPPAAPAPATPAASPVGGPDALGGPLIANVCLLSREQVFGQSLVGQAAIARLKQLNQKAQADFDAGRRKLEGEAKALQTQAQSGAVQPAQAQKRQQQLQARAQALQNEAGQVSRELEATRAKAMQTIEEAVRPVVAAAYAAKGCGLLLSREAVIGGNLGNDITVPVIQGLDAKMSTITFEREHLPPASAPH